MNLAKYMDHTILKPDTTIEGVKKICIEAIEHGFASVCINPYYTTYVSEKLKGTNIKTCVVIGFPLGANTKEVKAFEAAEAIENGADEVDMVINIGALKDKNYEVVKEDIEGVVKVASKKVIVKVIIETCLLTELEKVKACEISKACGADFVKTSTGFSNAGATPEDVALMRKTVGKELGVKASGGIRDYATALKMVEAGANRLGVSASVAIVNASAKASTDDY